MLTEGARLEFDLRASWQCRALLTAKGHTGAVLLSALAHTYDDAMLPLLMVAFPGFKSITAPFISSAGKIDRTGAIVVDVVEKNGTISKDVAIYKTEIELRDDFRRLADRMRLNDQDRIEMFKVVQRWVVADRRLDPSFDRKDPDAKRFLVN